MAEKQGAPARLGGFWRAFGPGLLFAGAAIGVSHLVQSTRAGALYGFGCAVFILAANAIKYPAFRFGPAYAAATGRSILVGYRRQGNLGVALFLLATLATMFVAVAAVSLVSAALLRTALGVSLSASNLAALLVLAGAVLLLVGRFRLLDWTIKALIVFLSFSTLLASAIVLPRISLSGPGDLWPADFSLPTIIFLAALMGWMPAPLDTAVWQSLWTKAKARSTGHAPTLQQSSLDFNIGYAATIFFAFCFLIMGAGLMHGSGVTFAAGAPAFSQQIVSLYEQTLGTGIGRLVGLGAFSVVFSTTLTALDAYPRTLAALAGVMRNPAFRASAKALPPANIATEREADPRAQRIALALLAAGSIVALKVFGARFRELIDFATTVSFLTAPVFAFLNHRAIASADVPRERRPAGWMLHWSAAGTVLMALLALGYLWIRFLA